MGTSISRYIFLLFILILLSCSRSGLKENADNNSGDTATVNNLIDMVSRHMLKSPDSVKLYLDSAEKISKRINFAKGIRETAFLKACQDYENNRYSQATASFSELLEQAKKEGDLSLQARCLERLGSIHLGSDDRHLALKQYYESLQISERIKDSGNIARIYNIIGFQKAEGGEPDTGIYYLKKALEINTGRKDRRNAIENLGNLAYVYETTGELSTADSIYHQLVSELRAQSDKLSLPVIYYNLASLNQKRNDSDSALFYLRNAIQVSEQNHDTSMLSVLYGNTGEIYLNLKKTDSARYYLEHSVGFSHSIDDVETELQAYSFLNLLDSATGNFHGLLRRLPVIMALQDSTHQRALRSNIKETELRYENEKKKIQLEEQAVALKIHAREKKLMIFILIISIAAGLLLARVVILQKNNYRKSHQLLGNQMLLDKLQLEHLHQNEELNKLKLEKYQEELSEKENELVSIALGIEQKKEILEQIRKTLMEASKSGNETIPVKQLLSSVNLQLANKVEVDQFNQQFASLHKDFFTNLQDAHPELTKTELKFCAYLKVQLSSSQIAVIMNVTSEAIRKTRYRIRKKIELPPESSLEDYINKF